MWIIINCFSLYKAIVIHIVLGGFQYSNKTQNQKVSKIESQENDCG